MKIISGDLIQLGKAGVFDVIIQGCNCQNRMGKGIALQIKQEFPEAYQADRSTTRGDRSKLGRYTYAVTASGLTVVNAYTQYDYWRKGDPPTVHVDYRAIDRAFQAIKRQWGGEGKKFGIPKIGAGLAGGDWSVISAVIDNVMADEDITLVEYTGVPAVQSQRK